ncbi:MAG: DUF4270 domain-containing protein [Flavobacteriaceae bacterium]
MKRTKQFLALLVVTLLVASCDKDYNTTGTDLVNVNHFNVINDDSFEIQTTNVKLDGQHPVQTNNLPYNTLGYYNDPVYGETTANVLTQVGLSEYGKEFQDGAVITKAKLTIPYFSRKISTNEDGEGEYELDSVYGNTSINLKLFRSEYYLNDFDPNTDFEERQKYYSRDNDFTLSQIAPASNLLYEKNDFLPTSSEVEVPWDDDDGVTQTARFSPRLTDSLNLDVSNFAWLLNDANEEALSSASNFKNFYRGIYLQATVDTPLQGVLLGLDLSLAEIEVTYEYTDPDGGADPLEDSIKILFEGNSVNTYDNNFNYTEEVDKIYLKGGEGAMAVLDLFSGLDDDADGISNELQDLRNRDVIINEANLEFFVDQNAMQFIDDELDRIFIYDINNNTVLLDYSFDNTSSPDPSFSKINHLGKLERDDSGDGVKYKIRITEHITNLVKKDSTNVSLGLIVSNNVSLLGSSSLKDSVIIGADDSVVNNDGDPNNDEKNDIHSVLSTSVNSHKGTVLFNENAIDDTKRLKLRIVYTEEDN